MQAKNMIEATATPPIDRLPRFARRYHTHNPEAGKNDNIEVLVSAAIPHSSPNSNQGRIQSCSSSSSVSQKMIASSNAARLVSHTQRVAKQDSSSAQNQDAQAATFALKQRSPHKEVGIAVSADK